MEERLQELMQIGKRWKKGSVPINSLPPMKSGSHAGKSTTQPTAILSALRLPEIVFAFLPLYPRIPDILAFFTKDYRGKPKQNKIKIFVENILTFL